MSETNDIVALRRDLKECENRLQQAGRLGLELHLQNDRLRRGIDHLQTELNGVHANNGVNGEQSEKMPFSTFSGSNGRLKAMENIKSTNALLQARNMSLNTHCEEADQRIEELMEQVQQLEKVLRKERMARKKLEESEAAREQQDREREEMSSSSSSSSSSSLTSSPRVAASPRSSSPTTTSPRTPRAPLRLEYASSPRGTTHEQPVAPTITTADISTMTLEERVASFLQPPPPSLPPPLTPSSSPTARTTQLLLSSSVATATTPSLWGPSSSPLSSPVNVALGIDTTSDHADEMRAAVMVDMHEDVLTLQRQLDVMEEEIIRERSLRDKLEHEVKVYHLESQRWSDEAGILSQRMRLAESARQSAETRARKIEVELRNMVLESDERKDKLQRNIVSEYQEKLSAVEEEKNIAVDRAKSFQHQAVQTLKKLMEMHQKQEEEKVKAQSSAADMHEHVRRVESAARSRGSTRMVPTAEPPTDHGYSLKLKKLEQMYERAGPGGDGGGD